MALFQLVLNKKELRRLSKRIKGLAESRRLILKQAKSKHIVHIGNRAVGSSRHCAICGKSLTRFSPVFNQWVATVNHYHIDLGVINTNICYSIHNCEYQLRKKGDKK